MAAKILHIIAPILLGAVIGYFTNDLAIRMLFRPRKPYFLGKWQLPFTPGIIPKNQSRIAAAVGEAVGGQLFTAGDLAEQLKAAAEKADIAGRVADAVFGADLTIRSLAHGSGEGGERGGMTGKIGEFVADRVVEKIGESDLHTVIEDLVWEGIQDYRKNPMLALFLNESAVDALCAKVETAIRTWAAGDGRTLVKNLVTEEADAIAEKPLRELAGTLGIDRDAVAAVVRAALDRFIGEFGASFSEKADISGIVREKIEQMDTAQLEELVMSVMKRELQAVINLGALLGAVIGAVNVLF